MSMKIDHFPTDLCPTIKDACAEVRLVDREAGVDFLRSDVGFGSLAAVQILMFEQSSSLATERKARLLPWQEA